MPTTFVNAHLPRSTFGALVLLVQDRVYRSLADLAGAAVVEWLQNVHPSLVPDPLPFIPSPPPRGRPATLASAPQVAVRLPDWLVDALKAACPAATLSAALREALGVWLENAHPDYLQRALALPPPALPPPRWEEVHRLALTVADLTRRVAALEARHGVSPAGQ